MSSTTTMTMTMPTLPPPRLSTIPSCPKCGNDLSLTAPPPRDSDPTIALRAAQKQISDLEAQVRLLNAKASAAVDKWADYEDELFKLRRELNKRNSSSSDDNNNNNNRAGSPATPRTPGLLNTPPAPAAGSGPLSPSVSAFATAATNRISALLSRKSQPNLKPPQQQPSHKTSLSTSRLAPVSTANVPGHHSSHSTSSLLTPRSPTTDDLLQALTREQQLRVAAEGKLSETSKEVEDLSVTLFEQANEMVASERRARARLEERVGELERREAEKKRRLERLEKAVGRIDRVRSLLDEQKKATAAG